MRRGLANVGLDARCRLINDEVDLADSRLRVLAHACLSRSPPPMIEQRGIDRHVGASNLEPSPSSPSDPAHSRAVLPLSGGGIPVESGSARRTKVGRLYALFWCEGRHFRQPANLRTVPYKVGTGWLIVRFNDEVASTSVNDSFADLPRRKSPLTLIRNHRCATDLLHSRY